MTHLTAAKQADPGGGQLTAGKRSVRRWFLGLVVLALAVAFLPEVFRVTLGSNFHTVASQRFYRAAQPAGATLKSYIAAYGIRTVVNLRGTNTGEDWFDDEE